MYYSMDVCLTIEACIDREKYSAFIFEDESGKQCVSADACRNEKGGYAYESKLKCVFVKPDVASGNFIKRYDGDYVYQCKEVLYV